MFQKICERLAVLKGVEAKNITMATRFSELNIDSLDIVELMMDLEDEYGVILEPDHAWETVGDVLTQIEAAVRERGGNGTLEYEGGASG